MSTIARTKNVWGRDIEPEYEARPPRPREQSRGVGIRIRGLEKRFGDVTVLHDLDLDVPAGQFLAIVGKSGCGKSTLLRLLVGLDAPTSGSISFVGQEGAPTEPNSRIVFQEPRLLPWASVIDNVVVGLGENVGRREARDRAEAALNEVQLAEKAGEWPSRLSGGQRQRAALARALVSEPGFLALDEPLGALDALTRITMQALIERVWREQGFTALFVTHDVSEAVALADRVIVLDEGRIALDITVEHDRPRQRGAADLAEIEGRLLKGIFK
ncbi:sulfonate transport system ATP-binding protein [Devosia lucknowensis]|uniref:Sulfonate transport system ATP-binding protein n=1 Tax=Devosia lucknowensis TaxID=1096929 RepID=A0A1Y6G7Q7_9HYPH|nr:ATP-binding cassette domain-containing protein [Devosia lucknowensis]SMQ86191.1 sulfonate transport system ATP-binding protein [Devosia lucknowensis]